MSGCDEGNDLVVANCLRGAQGGRDVGGGQEWGAILRGVQKW